MADFGECESFCFAEVNLANYAHNLAQIKAHLPLNAKILAVIKANAYGCGIAEIAKSAYKCGVYALGVARMDEALIVREALPEAKILILGYTPKELLNTAIAHNIELCVYHKDIAKSISREAQRQNKTAQIHIKIDTGMGRIGFLCDESNANDLLNDAQSISKLPNIQIAGIFTHFSSADEADLGYTQMQVARYCDFVKALESRGIKGFIRHCSNSAGIFSYPKSAFDMVRVGIVSYGISPLPALPVNLKPVLSLKARVVHIKTLPKDCAISYGRTFITPKTMRIATICAGYADGYSRLLSNKGEVLIRGIRAKVVGSVCMDQLCVDISDIKDAQIGDSAVLFGVDEWGNEISADELAQKIGTISYEIICAVSNRVPRVYKGALSL
ncbi:alanine racemase [Helicobacter sp. 23-1044]